MLQRDRQNRLVRVLAEGRRHTLEGDEAHGFTRHELAEALELNLTTVTRLTATLIERGLLEPHGRASNSTRGRPAETLMLTPTGRYAVGLEFGRDRLVAAVTDAAGNLVRDKRFATPPAFENTRAVGDALSAALRAMIAESGLDPDRVAAVGVALHDVVDAAGCWTVHGAGHNQALPIEAQLRRSLRLTTVAEDVSRAFAFAEQRRGVGANRPDATYVFVGPHGVGGGIFVNGRLLKSSTGVCGEVGHIVVVPDGKQCHCGGRGCLETVATPVAVVERYRELADQGVRTTLDAEAITFANVCIAATEGDKAAYLVLDELADYLAIALAATVNIAGGGFVIIGGPLRLAGEAFRGHLEAELRRRVVGPLLNHVTVCYATLSDSAGAWGVALQGLERAFREGSFVEVGIATPIAPEVAQPGQGARAASESGTPS